MSIQRIELLKSYFNPIVFRFPLSDAEKLQLWLKAIGRKGFEPNSGSRLCSDHFKQSDFYENPGGSYKLTLKNDAIPSIFQFSVHSTLLPTKLFSSEPQEKKNVILTIFYKLLSYPTTNR